MSNQEYKTEDQLKAEAKARREAEASAPKKQRSQAEIKAENFIYHNKLALIISAVVIVFAAVMINDVFLKPKPITTVQVITSEYFDIDGVEVAEQKLSELANELLPNSDKPVFLSFAATQLPNSGTSELPNNPQIDYANNIKLMAVLTAGVEPIFLLDAAAYDYILAMSEDVSPFYDITAPADFLGEKYAGMNFYISKVPEDETLVNFSKMLIEKIAQED